jgi:hypothetical protein
VARSTRAITTSSLMDQPVRVWVGIVEREEEEKRQSVALRLDRSPEVNRRSGICRFLRDVYKRRPLWTPEMNFLVVAVWVAVI